MIEWENLWKEFNNWHDKKSGPEWSVQQKKIEELVQKYIKKIEKERTKYINGLLR